jgi:hypothetical protein
MKSFLLWIYKSNVEASLPRGRKKSKQLPNKFLKNGLDQFKTTEKVPVPIDPLTGLVLSVSVTEDDFVSPENHWHHNNFSKKRPELLNLGGKAVRYSRMQFLPFHLHHEAYLGSLHEVFCEPENLPSEEPGQFMVANLSIAGVVPRDSIDLKSQNPTQPRRLTDREFNFISSPQITNVQGAYRRNEHYRRLDIGHFILDYSIQELFLGNVVTSRQISEYLNAKNNKRLRALGNQIIKRAIREALIPVTEIYNEAKIEGMVIPSRPDLHSSVNKVMPEHLFKNYYPKIANILAGGEDFALAA